MKKDLQQENSDLRRQIINHDRELLDCAESDGGLAIPSDGMTGDPDKDQEIVAERMRYFRTVMNVLRSTEIRYEGNEPVAERPPHPDFDEVRRQFPKEQRVGFPLSYFVGTIIKSNGFVVEQLLDDDSNDLYDDMFSTIGLKYQQYLHDGFVFNYDDIERGCLPTEEVHKIVTESIDRARIRKDLESKEKLDRGWA